MFPTGLFITTLFTISNFVFTQNGSFEHKARTAYIEYLSTQDEAQYDSNFVDNLYNFGYYTNSTTITVLTPGMYGDRDYWFPKIYNANSDNYETNYMSNDSLARKIINTQNFIDEDIPILSFKPIIEEGLVFKEVELQQIKYCDGEYMFCKFDLDYSDRHYLLNKHIVLIYDNDENIEKYGRSNIDTAYYFCNSLDSVLAKLVMFYQGNLPRINLIGHSRGGVLNLYYAQKRSAIVDNLITIASPINGSVSANMANSFINLLRNFDNTLFEEGNFSGITNSVDIQHQNEILSSLNSTHTVAIGAEMSPLLFCNGLLDSIQYIINESDLNYTFGEGNVIFDIFEEIIETLSTNDRTLMNTISIVCNAVKAICNSALSLINTAQHLNDLISILPCINSTHNFDVVCELTSSLLNDIKSLCDNIANYDENTMCIKSDFCVDLNSQLGIYGGTSNFDQTFTIPFGKPGYDVMNDSYLSNMTFPRVPHNYECNFPPITNLILTILTDRNSIDNITIPNAHYEMDINPYRVPFYNLTDYFINQFYNSDQSFYGSEFGFRDYYYYESEIVEHPYYLDGSIIIDDLEVITKRMRTGYIQNERIVLSPNRNNAGLAFLEFYFSEPIYGLSMDISLWSGSEWCHESEQRFAYTFNTEMRDFIAGVSPVYLNDYNNSQNSTMTARGKTAMMSTDDVFYNTFGFNRKSLSIFSTNRENPDKLYIGSVNSFSFVGIYTACYVTSFDRNKGRICLSNFEIYR